MGTFYMLLAFIVGLLLGWILRGRLRGELDRLKANLENTCREGDRLKADTNRLSGPTRVCWSERTDLERQLSRPKVVGGTAEVPLQAPPPPQRRLQYSPPPVQG